MRLGPSYFRSRLGQPLSATFIALQLSLSQYLHRHLPVISKKVVSTPIILISTRAIAAAAQPVQLAHPCATSTSTSPARSPLPALPCTKATPTRQTNPFLPVPAPSFTSSFLQRKADLLILQLEAESAQRQAKRAQQEVARLPSAFVDDLDLENEDDGLSIMFGRLEQVPARVPHW
ncbi:hypothetical protein JCM11641_006140 [Rhodosporidiobolus odoratus]